ncbi:unnamed protein product [Trypanosoma congolense IL3000]|uniref:WGS project CAEQ00000000 data, annotated contig 1027 n=1 Tax=Trypanosoma congolense (strain IL3000) TaxID=1068625 RepID=F9W3A8_TRYCI|nr:unnamed protein product [Trypanosoma congolense IL3000]
MRTLDIVPFNHKETEEIERERHLINEAISKATQLVERTVTTEEIENDVEAMKLVFTYEDVSQFYLDQPPLIAASYLKSIKEELIQRVIEISKCPTPADNSPRALAIRQRRRLQLAEVLTMKQRTKGPVDIRSLDTLNPRAVPQPWAHLCSYDLALDHKMDTLMRKHEQTSGFADEIFSYLTELSKRKEAENEAIFAKYPFIPPLPHGVPLSELGLPENDDFQRNVLRLEGCPDDIEAKNEMCRIAVRLAEWRAALRRGVSSPLPKNGQPVLRETLSPAGSKEDGSRDGTTTQSSGERSSQSGSSSISGVKTLLHSGGELAYGQFIVRCKEDFPRLLEQLRAQMPAQSMDDIHLTTENLEALRFFYDGAIRGNSKTLSYSDLEAFMLLTLGKELGMSVDNIQWLVRTSMVVNHTPRTLKFHDFSGFVKLLAASESFGSGARGNDLREVPRQNGRHVSESPRHVPGMVDVLLVPEGASSSSTTQGTGSQSTVGAASRTQGGTSRTTRLTPLRSSKPHPRHSSAGNSEMAERIVIRRPATTQHASAQEERHVQAPVAALEAQAWTTVSNKGACDVASGAHDVDDKTDGKTP